MPELNRALLPNIITGARVAAAPAVFLLALAAGFGAQLAAFIVFVVAAVSDLWDGYLARKHGWVSDFGKLMDPLADKLLMVATLVPIYMVSNPPRTFSEWPLWNSLPLWAVLVIFFREILITVLRTVAARRGLILPAQAVGKYKAFSQNFFVGTALLWHALHTKAALAGWTGPVWEFWRGLHGAVLFVSLTIAIGLTLISLWVYLASWRRALATP
ncbi:MAG TPA: CDP-alcohol phosphatidyltransferase family protein [Longimicrobiales bacterium]|jgi:CDP-diacylglycerol--glycerol-3-phosphate 3-phosphatidyltransferase|nr:CDP-alcohol phosphatidyltransferase family protein [Longimicrobiales bacterium]